MFNPEKPMMPNPDGCCGPAESCSPGAPAPGYCAPAWVPECPPPPPPTPPVPPAPYPGLRPIPPCSSVLEGSSLYESMNQVISRVNTCINQWNQISANCYEALGQVVAAARANDVYYDDCEVKYTEGYDEIEGCAYALIRKRAVDRCNRPIHVHLELAYNNTTNPGVKEPIMTVSYKKCANVIMTAVPSTASAWYGPAMYRGAPIPGYIPEDDDPTNAQPPVRQTYWVYGFNRQGALRFFRGDVEQQTLIQNGMVDCVGGCVPILYDGKFTEQVDYYKNKMGLTALGYNSANGDVFFLGCSIQDQTGMTAASVAKVLQGYGCTTAVITSMTDNVTMSGQGMEYLGQMCFSPNQAIEPENLAYWVIDKRPTFKNAFQKEIAQLVQNTGRNAWKNYLLAVEIQEFNQRILDNKEAIEAEVKRATEAEKQLQENIDDEAARAIEAERQLQENIDAETERAKAAEAALDAKIDAETQRAMDAENDLSVKIAEETARATAAEAENARNIQKETLRAINRENEIQASIDKEIRERIAADNDIINALEQEILARRAADTEIRTLVEVETTRAKQAESNLQTQIDTFEQKLEKVLTGAVELPYLKLTGGTLTGNLTMADGTTVILGRGPTTDLEAATKKYVDDAIEAGGGGGTGGDVSKEYVDEQVATLQGELDGKVNRDGDTMTGSLGAPTITAIHELTTPMLIGTAGNDTLNVGNLSGGPININNVKDPTAPSHAATKSYVDQQITDSTGTITEAVEEALGEKFVKKTGDTMSGDLAMTDQATVQFYDSTSARALLASGAMTLEEDGELKPSNVARKMGVTQELVERAAAAGLDPETATIEDVATTLALDPADLVGMTLRGSVYNDAEDMCVSSASGDIGLKGKKVKITDGAGSGVPLEIGNITIQPHNSNNEHLDINVPTEAGEVYINRSSNNTVQNGGTGGLVVTTIKAPNELDLIPGTKVDLNGHGLKGVASLEPQSQRFVIFTGDTNYNAIVIQAGTQASPGEFIKIFPAANNNLSSIDNIDLIRGRKTTISFQPSAADPSSSMYIESTGIGTEPRLRRVADPISETDAINLRTLKTYSGYTSNFTPLTSSFTFKYFNTTECNTILGNAQPSSSTPVIWASIQGYSLHVIFKSVWVGSIPNIGSNNNMITKILTALNIQNAANYFSAAPALAQGTAGSSSTSYFAQVYCYENSRDIYFETVDRTSNTNYSELVIPLKT